MRIVVICVFVSLVASLSLKSQTQSATTRAGLSDEEYRRQNLELGQKKAIYSAIGIGVPILAGLLTLAGAILTANKAAKAQAVTKAAELALQGEGPQEVKNRALLLASFYGDLLPKHFATHVDAIKVKDVGRIVTQAPWVAELKREIVKVLAENPSQREQIIADYRRLYPQYEQDIWNSFKS